MTDRRNSSLRSVADAAATERGERAASSGSQCAATRWNLATFGHGKTPEWETPQPLFDALNAEFGFTLDVCATPENAKCRRYFTIDDDGLSQPWSGVVFCNPPYGREIVHWIRKAFESAAAGATVVCLIPARTDAGWFHDYAMRGEVRFIRGRVRFSGSSVNAPFPSAVVVFRGLPAEATP